MRQVFVAIFITSFITLGLALTLGCRSEYPIDLLSATEFASDILITTAATDPGTGPGMIVLFSSDGQVKKILQDLYAGGTNVANGAAFVPPSRAVFAIDGVDALQLIDLITGAISTYTNTGLSATPIRQMTRDSVDGSYYVVESTPASVEKFDSNFERAGNPFINTTTGTCVLATPNGIAFIPTTQRIAVVSMATAGRLSIYDKDGNCISHLTTSPMNAGTPNGVAYHAPSNKLIITRATDHFHLVSES